MSQHVQHQPGPQVKAPPEQETAGELLHVAVQLGEAVGEVYPEGFVDLFIHGVCLPFQGFALGGGWEYFFIFQFKNFR